MGMLKVDIDMRDGEPVEYFIVPRECSNGPNCEITEEFFKKYNRIMLEYIELQIKLEELYNENLNNPEYYTIAEPDKE